MSVGQRKTLSPQCLTGIEPMTSRTYGRRSIHWATRPHGEQSLLTMTSTVLILEECRTPVTWSLLTMTSTEACHMNSVKWPCSPWVLVAQWLEHPPCVWEVMGSILVGDWCFLCPAHFMLIIHLSQLAPSLRVCLTRALGLGNAWTYKQLQMSSTSHYA